MLNGIKRMIQVLQRSLGAENASFCALAQLAFSEKVALKQKPARRSNSLTSLRIPSREHLSEGPESEKSSPFLVQPGGRLVFPERSAERRVAPCHWTAGKEHHGGPRGSVKHAKLYSELQGKLLDV